MQSLQRTCLLMNSSNRALDPCVGIGVLSQSVLVFGYQGHLNVTACFHTWANERAAVFMKCCGASAVASLPLLLQEGLSYRAEDGGGVLWG